MGNQVDIKDAFRKLTEKNGEDYCCVCTVDSVDTTAKTAYCIPIETGKADLANVRLMCDTSKKGFLITPKVGSYVVVSFLNNETGYISLFSEVDSVFLNSDNYGGLVKITDLVGKINALENTINNMLTVLNGITVTIGAGGGSVPFAPFFSAISQIAPITQNSDLENTTVKHGNGN